MNYFSALLLAVSLQASAGTIGPGCGFEWDYYETDRALIDGFRIYVDGTATATAPADAGGISCADSGITQGVHTVEVTAFNAVDESDKSNSVAAIFVEFKPGAPSSLRSVIGFGSQ